jgi:energy-coupling factor transport system ATP-binding protein
MEPDYMIMDEPTSMLDFEGSKDILEIIDKLLKSGKTVIMSSHNLEELKECQRILYLRDGEIIYDDIPDTVFNLLKDSCDVEVPV